MMLLLIFLAILVSGMVVFYFVLLFSFHSEAPFVPTGRRDMRRILEISKIKPGEVVYDLGSGDGRVVREAARRGAKAVGVERSHMLVWWARMISADRFFPSKFICGDFFKKDLGDADVIFCYLMPEAIEHLKEKFGRELRPGTRLISRAFPIHGWEPAEVFHFGKRSPKVYLYKITQPGIYRR